MSKFELFERYIRELRAIRNEPVRIYEIKDMYAEILELIGKGVCEWIDVDGVGFVVIAQGNICYRSCDYYIIDTYIHPEYRRIGMMSYTIKDYTKNHPGRYCLEIINNNTVAKSFWNSIAKLHTITDWHTDDIQSTPYWFEI